MNTYEEKMKRLEEIVERLEMRDVPLNEALEIFEEGVRLVREIDAMLHGAEGKIQKLMEGLRLQSADETTDSGSGIEA